MEYNCISMSTLTIAGIILLLLIVWLISMTIRVYTITEIPSADHSPSASDPIPVNEYLSLLGPLPPHAQLLVGIPAQPQPQQQQLVPPPQQQLPSPLPQQLALPPPQLPRRPRLPMLQQQLREIQLPSVQLLESCPVDLDLTVISSHDDDDILCNEGGGRVIECDQCEGAGPLSDGDSTSNPKHDCQRSWTTMNSDFTHPDGDYQKLSMETPEDCGRACLRDQPTCRSWTYNQLKKMCKLKDKVAPMVQSPGDITGQTVHSKKSSIDADVEHVGNDYHQQPAGDPKECSYACLSDQPRCKAWTYLANENKCRLKDKVPAQLQESKGNFTGQLAYPNYVKPQPLGPPEPIDTNSLYTIEDADGNFRLAVLDTAVSGLLSNQNPINMIQGAYSQCAGQNCAFRFVDQGDGVYSIETASGSGRLSMLNKSAQGGLKDKNPVFVYNGLQGTCAGVGINSDCVFKLIANDDKTWRIEAGDSTGRLAFWDKKAKWDEVYADPATRSLAEAVPIFMFVGGQEECPGNDCKFKLTKVGTLPTPPPIDSDSLYMITDALGYFQMIWGMDATGNNMQASLAMYQVAEPNCQGTAAGHCTFRFVPQNVGAGLFSIETADGSGRMDMWGKTAQGGLKNGNPVYMYTGLQATCPGDGTTKDCLFKVVATDRGTWRIEAGDCSGRLAFWDLTSKWRQMYNNAQTRDQANALPLQMCTCSKQDCGHDCEFRLVKVDTPAQPLGCQYTTTFSGCNNGSIYIQNCKGQFLLPAQGQSTPTWVNTPTTECCFNLVDPPFGGQYPKNSFSVESVAFSGSFLRHSASVVRLDSEYTRQNDDFVFQFLPALNGQPKSFTMKPVQQDLNKSCFFNQDATLRFQNGLCPINDQEFQNAASFNLGTSKLKSQSLCKYTTSFTGCTDNSIYIQNCDGQYLAAVQSQWLPTWVSEPSTACCFNLVTPPYGGQYPANSYSLESVGFAGNFLKHTAFTTLVKDFNCQNYASIKNALPGNTNQFMMSAVLNVVSYNNTESQWAELFHAGNPDASTRTPGVWLLNGYLHIRATTTEYYDEGGAPCSPPNIVPQLQFGNNYHLLAIYDKQNITAYLNGNLIANCPTSGEILTYRDLYVGAIPAYPLGANINMTVTYIPGVLNKDIISSSWQNIRDMVGTPLYPLNTNATGPSGVIMTLDNGYTEENNAYVFQFSPSVGGRPGTFSMKPVSTQSYSIAAGSYDNATMAGSFPGWQVLAGDTSSTISISFTALAPGADIRVFLADSTATIGYSVVIGAWSNTACGILTLPAGDIISRVSIPGAAAFSQSAPNACVVTFNTAAGTITVSINGVQALSYSAGTSLVSGITQYNFGAGATGWTLSDISVGNGDTTNSSSGSGAAAACFSPKGSYMLLDNSKCASFNLGTTQLQTSSLLKPLAGYTPTYIPFDANSGDCAGMNGDFPPTNANQGETSEQLFARCEQECNSNPACKGMSFNGSSCYKKIQNCATGPYNRTQNGYTFYYNPETTSYIAYDPSNGDCQGMDWNFPGINANPGESAESLFSRCEKQCDSSENCRGFSFSDNGSVCYPKIQDCSVSEYSRAQNGFTFYSNPKKQSTTSLVVISNNINSPTPILVGYTIVTPASPNITWTGGSGAFSASPPYTVTALSSGTTATAYYSGSMVKFVVYNTSRPGQATISFTDAQGTNFSVSGGYGYGSEVFFNTPANNTAIYAPAAPTAPAAS